MGRLSKPEMDRRALAYSAMEIVERHNRHMLELMEEIDQQPWLIRLALTPNVEVVGGEGLPEMMVLQAREVPDWVWIEVKKKNATNNS